MREKKRKEGKEGKMKEGKKNWNEVMLTELAVSTPLTSSIVIRHDPKTFPELAPSRATLVPTFFSSLPVFRERSQEKFYTLSLPHLIRHICNPKIYMTTFKTAEQWNSWGGEANNCLGALIMFRRACVWTRIINFIEEVGSFHIFF
jgi:hypothetical protein